MTLAWVQWINPWWAVALPLAVAVPLLAHLRQRGRPREVLLPTARFARAAAGSYQHWAQPRHRLILTLRALLLAFMVAALAGPTWVGYGDGVSGDGGWNVVLVVDRSASMSRSVHGATLFDEAKSRAMDVIESLDPSRDRASVVWLDAYPTTLLPRPTGHFPLLVNRLTHSQPTFQRGDLPAALRLAAQQAAAGSAVLAGSEADIGQTGQTGGAGGAGGAGGVGVFGVSGGGSRATKFTSSATCRPRRGLTRVDMRWRTWRAI